VYIRSVEVEGFRGYKEHCEIFFDETLNEISGGNGLGKSSIAEIISFGIAGVDKFGKERAADRLMNQDCTEFKIVINAVSEDRAFTVERQVVKLKGKTDHRIYLNGVQSPQDMIDQLIGNRRHFMASFLPKFLLGMTDKELEEEIIPLIPIPKQEEVIALLVEDDPEAALILEGVSLLDPNFYIKNQSIYLKEQKEELIRLDGALQEVNDALEAEIPEKVTIDSSEIDSLKSVIAAIERSIPVLIDVQALKNEMAILQNQKQMLQQGLNFEEHLIQCDNCGHEINLNKEQEQKNQAITDQILAVDAQIQALEDRILAAETENKLNEEEFNSSNLIQLNDTKAILQLSEEKLEITKGHNIQVDLMIENKTKAKSRKREIIAQKAQANKVIENTEKLIKAVKLYNNKRCDMQVKAISVHLNRASIRLFELVKSTGEMKPAFKATFDGKEVRLLSTSEEIRCFLEFSNLIRKLTDKEYPVFVDCAESIEHYDMPNTQVFEARFVPGQTLKVNGEEVIHG
jgi:hypothetical protein